MHVNTFDHYQAGESLVHRLDPRVKVVVTVLFILSNVLLPDGAWLAFLLAWGLVLLVSALTGLGLGYAVRRSFMALPFALAAVSAIFTLPGQPLFAWNFPKMGPMSGPWHIVATDAGLVRFATIVVRSWLSIQMAILLTATTRFPDLMHALHHLHIPKLLIAITSFMYRYLFVLTDEAMRLMRAREARSARPTEGGGGGSIIWRARVAGNMAGQLFLRSYERSDRVYNAMLARGYDGQFLTINPHTMHTRDWAIGTLSEILPEATVRTDRPLSRNGRHADSAPPTLVIENLNFSYPDGHVALHDVSLQIGRGEKIALVGPNGAGKSTLMLHLNGILNGQGQVQVAGLSVTKPNLPTVRARVGLVFQNPDDQLFSPTVFEDVAFGPLHMGLPEDEVCARVARALEQVGMNHYADRLSHHLSVGEKKRVAIATVLSMDPEILALDEPSAGLDPRARRALIALLRDLPLTMLVSTHDMLMVRELFPRIVIMDEGRIVADGPTEWLMNNVALLETHGLAQ